MLDGGAVKQGERVGLVSRAKRRVLDGVRRRVIPSPVSARHAEYSMLYSEDDAASRPSERLLDLALDSARLASATDLSDVSARMKGRLRWPDAALNLWPGEHYRLLAALVQVLRPAIAVEIGTAEGLSALSMLKYLPRGARLITFDLIPWKQYPNSCLQDSDFSDGRFVQSVGDISAPDRFDKQRELFSRADLVFIDAAKDGVMERELIRQFDPLPQVCPTVFVFDDIRLWNMLATWRALRWPKLDVTSFGHWTGTGLAERAVGASAGVESRSPTMATVEFRP
jgi:hypothetical protein